MKYVIYHKETTYYMRGMKRGGYGSKGAATAALNKMAEKTAYDLATAKFFKAAYAKAYDEGGTSREVYDKAKNATIAEFGIEEDWNGIETNDFLAERDLVKVEDYAIAEAGDFHDNIEKMVTRVNLMSRKEYEERANTPRYCSPASESYWSM